MSEDGAPAPADLLVVAVRAASLYRGSTAVLPTSSSPEAGSVHRVAATSAWCRRADDEARRPRFSLARLRGRWAGSRLGVVAVPAAHRRVLGHGERHPKPERLVAGHERDDVLELSDVVDERAGEDRELLADARRSQRIGDLEYCRSAWGERSADEPHVRIAVVRRQDTGAPLRVGLEHDARLAVNRDGRWREDAGGSQCRRGGNRESRPESPPHFGSVISRRRHASGPLVWTVAYFAPPLRVNDANRVLSRACPANPRPRTSRTSNRARGRGWP